MSFEFQVDKMGSGSDDRRSPIINSSPAKLSKTIETANRDLRSHLRRAAEDAGQPVVALDRALEEELTRSIELCLRRTRSGPVLE